MNIVMAKDERVRERERKEDDNNKNDTHSNITKFIGQ